VLGHGLQVSGELKLVDTVVLGLSEHNASRVRSLSASSSHGASVHNVTLLSLVPQLSGLLGSSGVGQSNDSGSLSVLPGSDSKQETHHVALLVSPDFFHVLVSSHRLLVVHKSDSTQQPHTKPTVKVPNNSFLSTRLHPHPHGTCLHVCFPGATLEIHSV
jgi:hypothetical protein